jgi:hypothetical protein
VTESVSELLGFQLHRADELRDRGIDPTKIAWEDHGRVLNGVMPPPADAWLVTPPTAPDLDLVPIADFVAVEEPGAEPLVGDDDGAVIPTNGDVMVYGPAGGGKTTLAVDFSLALAAGDDWLGLPVPHAVCVALVESEGPRALFRAKLRRKLEAWRGSPIGNRLHVLENPWGAFSFADPDWREALAAALRYLTIDVLIVGPVTSSGFDEAGTQPQTREFMALVDQLRAQTGRRLTVILIHHPNRAGAVSGAWEPVVDTLLHVQGQGNGRTRLFFQKARWASAQHGTALNLLWTDGEGFEVEDPPERPSDETIAELICEYVRENAGTGWGRVRATIKGGTGPAQSVLPLAAEGTATSVPCAAPKGGTDGTGTVADTPPLDEAPEP